MIGFVGDSGATAEFRAAVGEERSDLVKGFHPWTRVTSAAAVAQLLRDGGAPAPTVEAERGT